MKHCWNGFSAQSCWIVFGFVLCFLDLMTGTSSLWFLLLHCLSACSHDVKLLLIQKPKCFTSAFLYQIRRWLFGLCACQRRQRPVPPNCSGLRNHLTSKRSLVHLWRKHKVLVLCHSVSISENKHNMKCRALRQFCPLNIFDICVTCFSFFQPKKTHIYLAMQHQPYIHQLAKTRRRLQIGWNLTFCLHKDLMK